MKKLLVSRESACLQPIRKLIEKQKHRTLVLWTIECAEHVLPIFEEKYPQDKRPHEAIEAAKTWASGKIKMPIAKKAAHSTHNAATAVAEENPAACAAARAMGHVVGTIQVETHAMGFVMYAITAFVYAANQKNVDEVITKICDWLFDRLLYWEANIDKVDFKWAPFLLKNNIPNKEALLKQKKEQKQ
ncbi:MAG TPA: Imm5 family immunity protein [Candidatus Bathyarchaeia archaeon]|nr:Imm5 family immunity protein [Candidatus Bathyarchaeia archaeon]